MRDGIIYDCPNANCKTPIYTGKCSKACIEKYNKEVGIKPKTNADRFRNMSDEELVAFIGHNSLCDRIQDEGTWCEEQGVCEGCLLKWLKQPAEG